MASRALVLPLVLMAALAAPVLVGSMVSPAEAQNNGNANGNPNNGNNGNGPNPSRGNAGGNSGNNTTSGGVRFAPPFPGGRGQ